MPFWVFFLCHSSEGWNTKKYVLIGRRERISLEHWVSPRRMGGMRQEAMAEFLWQPEIPNKEMTKGKKIAQELAGGRKALPIFAEDDQSSISS